MTKHSSHAFGLWHLFLVLLFFTCLCTNGCKKSSSDAGSSSITPSCGDTCLLTKYYWEMDSIAINTNVGTFSNNANLNQLPWSTFDFDENLSFTDYGGDNGSYSWTGSAQVALIFPPITSPIHFNVTVSPTSLALATLTVQLHPQVNTSYEANAEVANNLPALHDEFQVDTSKLTYIQTTFYYSVKQ